MALIFPNDFGYPDSYTQYRGPMRTRKFHEVFPDFETFEDVYENWGIPDRLLTGDKYEKYDLETIYGLLLGEFANHNIYASDEDRFILSMLTKIMQYGPQWQREMAIQDEILNLSDEELALGDTVVYNHAMHPDTSPSTQTLTELQYIDSQNVTKTKLSNVERITRIIPFLDDSATKNFLDKFRPLFNTFAETQNPLEYVSGPGFDSMIWY